MSDTPQAIDNDLPNILEALLLASDQPLSLDALQRLLTEDGAGDRKVLRAALESLQQRYEGTALSLDEVASGWRIRVVDSYADWVHRLWAERPPKLSRALLETLAIICYRQPVTRSDIEEVRGVTVSSNILRTLTDRGWIREAGVKEVPGRPALLVTTPQLLDDLGLKSLDELPPLPEVKDPEQLEAALLQLAEKRGIRLDAGDQSAGDQEEAAQGEADLEQAGSETAGAPAQPSVPPVDPPEQLH
ncbi:SMC-Scp complex subunit ScpB [Algiphilus aromaticivorans]|uniref:SMC-Scp complex subunit ScpB n=1 Tax=Algiphilus aromaticivorans TaxID=382454 RepID=UPI000A66E495|nr:SMC-Scp complex subunit ScpB [Algiphilus aromaticivorans]